MISNKNCSLFVLDINKDVCNSIDVANKYNINVNCSLAELYHNDPYTTPATILNTIEENSRRTILKNEKVLLINCIYITFEQLRYIDLLDIDYILIWYALEKSEECTVERIDKPYYNITSKNIKIFSCPVEVIKSYYKLD